MSKSESVFKLEPKVSVVIPVYNVEQYLAACLESVLSQTLKEIEIICINDGSTDNSLEILENYAKQDERIKVFSQENQGLSAARNAGLRHVKGKYISFLDSDDMFAAQDVLFALYHEAEQMQTELLCTDLKVQVEIEKQFSDSYYKRKESYEGIFNGKQLFCEMMNHNDFFNLSWLLFLNREWLFQNQIMFYTGILYEDILFSFLCYMNAERAAYLKKDCYIYRIRENSIMNRPPGFLDLNSYLVCYREIIKEVFSHNWTEAVLKEVKKYLDLLCYNIKHTAEIMNDNAENEKRHFELMIDEILASSLEIDRQTNTLNKQAYFDGFHQLLEKSEKIIIYGAGQVGLLMYHYLQYKNLERKVDCFCVTSSICDKRSIDGVPVRNIEMRQVNKNKELLVISVRKNYQKEMLETAERLGYNKIVVIDYQLEQMMLSNIESGIS